MFILNKLIFKKKKLKYICSHFMLHVNVAIVRFSSMQGLNFVILYLFIYFFFLRKREVNYQPWSLSLVRKLCVYSIIGSVLTGLQKIPTI